MKRGLIAGAAAALLLNAANENYGRLPYTVQAVLCRLRFGPSSRCPHIIPGGRWNGR